MQATLPPLLITRYKYTQHYVHIPFSVTHTMYHRATLNVLPTIGWRLERVPCDDSCYMTSHEDRSNKHVTPDFNVRPIRCSIKKSDHITRPTHFYSSRELRYKDLIWSLILNGDLYFIGVQHEVSLLCVNTPQSISKCSTFLGDALRFSNATDSSESVLGSLRLVTEEGACNTNARLLNHRLALAPLFPIMHSLSRVTLSLNCDSPPLTNVAEALRHSGALGTRHPLYRNGSVTRSN